MTNTFAQIGINLLSNLIFTIIAAALSILFIAFYKKKRKRLFSFFGIDPTSRRLHIYSSRLDVCSGGSNGVDGRRLSTGFIGPALVQRELNGANKLCDLFKNELDNLLPKFLQGMIADKAPYLRKVETKIEASPAGDESIFNNWPDAGVVLLGTDVYNFDVHEVYKHKSVSFIDFVEEDSCTHYDAATSYKEPSFCINQEAGAVSTPIPGRKLGREVGTIQRVTHNNHRVMMCAGISSSSTEGAARYLAKNWQELESEFGTKDFLVVLFFEGQVADADPVVATPDPDYERSRRSAIGSGLGA